MNLWLFTTAALLCAALQARLPTAWWLGGVRFEFLPALVAYGSLSFRHWGGALALAVLAGLLQDALSAGPFGRTSLAYALAAFGLVALARAFDRRQLWMQLLAGATASVAASLMAMASLGFRGAMPKLLFVAGISALVTPPLFFALDLLGRRMRSP